MKIAVAYDYAAWPVGGHYAYDEETWDGDPDNRAPLAWGRTPSDAIEELAATMLSAKGYEDLTPEQLDAIAVQAADVGDLNTTKLVQHLREFI